MSTAKTVMQSTGPYTGKQPLARENEMKNVQVIFGTGGLRNILLVCLTTALIGSIPVSAFADEAPEFTFKDRCVPYQLTDEQMLLNGIDPDRILGGADGGGGGPGGKFTDDAAGRRAFEIADHFVIYEMVQNGPPELAANPSVPVQSIATNPFFGGFAVGTQTKIINSGDEYWQVNPAGIWKIGFVRFTQKAFDAIANPGTYPDDYAFLVDMATTNGVNSQGAVNGGLPLIVKGDEIFDLVERGLASLRYRIGADGQPGEPEGPRYLLCPVHQDPASNSSIIVGEDIIQKWPTRLEFQVPCAHVYSPDGPRGHNKFCAAFPFGPTPPPTEQCLYDHFDCLQQTGDWCGGSFKSGAYQCPPPPFVYED